MVADIRQFVDPVDLRQFFDLRQASQLDRSKPCSTAAFDITFAVTTLFAICGLALDYRSHMIYGTDQTLFSTYHLLIYTATVMVGWLLAYTGITNVLAGYRWSDALPVGYGWSLAGLIFFGLDSYLDSTFHAMWGFEAGLEALSSPTHIGLFAGIFVFASGPIRAEIARQRRNVPMTFARLVPFVLAVVATIGGVTPATFADLPAIDSPWALQTQRVSQGDLLAVLGVVIETATMMGVLLWVLKRVRVPAGSMTLIFVVFYLVTMITTGSPVFLPIWLIAGILSDVAMVILKPSSGVTWRFRAFGAVVPVVLWTVYYAFFMITGLGGGVWITGYVWTGSIVEAGIIGYMLAFAMTPAHTRSEER